MSSPAAAPNDADLPAPPLRGASPKEVRAALTPEDRASFDRGYQAALVRAGQSLDLTELHDLVEAWRCRSWVTRDPAEHRQIVRLAAERLTGLKPPEDEPVAVTESRL